MRHSFSGAACRANARHGGEVRFKSSLTMYDVPAAAGEFV
jgi:hypothetical protein